MGQDNTYILLYREVRKVKDLFELYIKTRNKDIFIHKEQIFLMNFKHIFCLFLTTFSYTFPNKKNNQNSKNI